MSDLARLTVNTIKALSMDAVQAANSGHPGMPMGSADMAYVLWKRFLKFDPQAPEWPDRDRFVLSAGHGSMLLYSLLHLSGYAVSLDDIKAFRQLGSNTPGHPEYGETPGVETTTGPLGQGFATGVGMAVAERRLRERFGADLCDHWIYGIVGDGDLMEGVASEAASLAGHLKLGRLIYLYDDNRITIDGTTDVAFTEDRAARFAAYGWHVLAVDGHDHEAVAAAIEAAKSDDRPSLLLCRTHIGHSSPTYQDTSDAHGKALGEPEIRRVKEILGLDPDAHFAVPAEVLEHMAPADGPSARAAWEARLAAHADRDEWARWHAAPAVDALTWPEWAPGDKDLATRKASAAALKVAQAGNPQLFGGSADLAGSNGVPSGPIVTADDFASGLTIAFGVREHAMGAICNGMSLHGGVRPYCATFLAFHNYMRPAVRLSALMHQPVIYIYTHDSILLGEDGPTHQPVEALMALRSLPNTLTLRPADANETAAAWRIALSQTDRPTALVLTRQGLPHLEGASGEGVERGGYVLAEAEGELQAVIVATGSEVSAAVEARAALQAEGVGVRVVSLPSWELFDAQDEAYRESVLPFDVPTASVEAGRTLGWERYTGRRGVRVGVDRFGASAPWKVLRKEFGLDGAGVAAAVRGLLGR